MIYRKYPYYYTSTLNSTIYRKSNTPFPADMPPPAHFRTVANKKQSLVNTPSHTSLSSRTTTDHNTEKPLLEIFGIHLYFDDILLICLIFFLYTEGVQDQYLLIALVLLLLS